MSEARGPSEQTTFYGQIYKCIYINVISHIQGRNVSQFSELRGGARNCYRPDILCRNVALEQCNVALEQCNVSLEQCNFA